MYERSDTVESKEAKRREVRKGSVRGMGEYAQHAIYTYIKMFFKVYFKNYNTYSAKSFAIL